MNKPETNLKWLHISDFHFKTNGPYDQDVVLRAFCESLPNLSKRFGEVDIVFASGDIAFSGQKAEYEKAGEFFDNILEILNLSRDRLIVVPGNHDVDRGGGIGLARSLTSRQEADDYFDPRTPSLHIQHRQRNFINWYNEYFFSTGRVFSESSSCGRIECLNIGGRSVGILPINTAIFSRDDEDHGKLWIGRRCLDIAVSELDRQKVDTRIAILHHPLDWLTSIEGQNVREKICSAVDCVLQGHLHVTDASNVATYNSSTLFLSAGATYQTTKHPNTAMFAELAGEHLSIMPIRYEDAPKEIWTIDPSVFPQDTDFRGNFRFPRASYVETDRGVQTSSDVEDAVAGHASDRVITSNSQKSILAAARAEFEQDLFFTPSREALYAEPRLMKRPQDPGGEYEETVERVSIDEVVASQSSFMIETRAEYGGTSLSKRLVLEFAKAGTKDVYRRDARNLPNYQKKLEGEFPSDALVEGKKSILILDHFDLERDEKLLRELSATRWFQRIIVITVNRSLFHGKLIDSATLPIKFDFLYLWNIGRAEVRNMAKAMFSTGDELFVSTVVDKIYGDLLGLCIPLTPANVIMYLKVLHREGEFHPLNRVDIVGRYLQEILRRPSDAYRDTFNSKNKIDVLSAFVYRMYLDHKNAFDEAYWHSVIGEYKAATLTEFDGAQFLMELLESRILTKYGSTIFLKYNFFFSFFLGRYIAQHSEVLEKFLVEEEYLRMDGVVDVITGQGSENSLVVETLVNKLESNLSEFYSKYVRSDFDPLVDAIWPDDSGDEERLWKPIAAQIEAGPKSPEEVDIIKSSIPAESRTVDQQVRFAKFAAMESSLFLTRRLLSEALKNSDDISGALKIRAFDAILSSHKVAFQVGAILSSEISEYRYCQWGGLAFIDFDRAADWAKEKGLDVRLVVIDALNFTVALKAAEEIGMQKLSAVFRAKQDSIIANGFVNFLNFNCVLYAKGPGWEETLAECIRRADKNSFYLSSMLGKLMRNVRVEVNHAKEIEGIKRLVALIRAKRSLKKQEPGAKAVKRVLARLEKLNEFESKSEGN